MKTLYMVRLGYAVCINSLSGLVHAYVQLIVTFFTFTRCIINIKILFIVPTDAHYIQIIVY